MREYYEDNGVLLVHIRDKSRSVSVFNMCLEFMTRQTLAEHASRGESPACPLSEGSGIAIVGAVRCKVDNKALLLELYLAQANGSRRLGNLHVIAEGQVVLVLEKGINTIVAPVGVGLFNGYVSIMPFPTLSGPNYEVRISRYATNPQLRVETDKRCVLSLTLARAY